MEPRIRRWQTQYRAAGMGGHAVARLDGHVRARAAEAYADALERTFGHDPKVYVLRRLRVELTVVNPSLADETSIARRWGARAAAAAVRTVARHGDDSSLVMRFESEAEFLACFLADLLDGVAWDRWYYAPFVRYRGRSFASVVCDLLGGARESLPEVLRGLTRSNHMRALVARLSPEAAREIWDVAISPPRDTPAAEDFRVFVRAAMAIVDAIASWEGARPEENAIVERYGATCPELPDWKRPRELARAVFAVLAFMRECGLVRAPIVSAATLQVAIASMDWLDRAWLRASIEALVVQLAEAIAPIHPTGDPHANESWRAVVSAAISVADALELWSGSRPAEDRILELFAVSIPDLPASEPRELARAVIAVLAFLRECGLVHAPSRWSRPALHAVVASLAGLESEPLEDALAAWLDQELPAATTVMMGSPGGVMVGGTFGMPAAPRPMSLTALQRRILQLLLQLLHRGELVLSEEATDVERSAITAFAALAAAEPSIASHPATPATIAWLLRMRAPETSTPMFVARPLEQVIAAILEQPPSREVVPLSGRIVESRFAGLFLLSRALIDARVPQLAAAMGAVPFSGVLRALTCEWTGHEPDEALLFWSGSDDSSSVAVPQAAFDALAAAVERVVRDRAAFVPSLNVESDLASNVVRLWAQWLRGLAQSSVPWLLRQFLIRPGTIRINAGAVAVSLAPAPLDAVLELSHYFDPIATVPWLDDARLTFAIDRSLA